MISIIFCLHNIKIILGGYESCQDVKQKMIALNGSIPNDGEYQLLLAGKNISVYCHEMASVLPKEYITLPRGERENYSEIYGLRFANFFRLGCSLSKQFRVLSHFFTTVLVVDHPA